ncbi:MAG: hypothetical protein JWO38_4169 [Gemmataceae bacterium]|nr:hypothetical protein [Gemmataceae bacterium]
MTRALPPRPAGSSTQGGLVRQFPLIFLAVLLGPPAPAAAFDPTEKYEKREVRGFAVLVNPEVLKHPDEAKETFAELDAQLRNLAAVVPEKPLAGLRKVRIWVEWEAKKNGAAEFHHSAGWLKDNGYNPDKLDAVEINNARNFVTWSRKDQPWMVMHELAHAYHFTVLGDKCELLQAAYKQAKERKLYDEVERVGGKKQRAYAMTDPAEYFAELTEAYFGKNDFYPFTRDELRKHDPVGFELMKTAWGEVR